MIISISLLTAAVIAAIIIRIKIGSLHPAAALYLSTEDTDNKVRCHTKFDLEAARLGNQKACSMLASPFPPHVECHDFELPGQTVHLKCKSYNYHQGQEQQVILFYFHGGGFCLGTIETHDSLCTFLAKESSACVISVDYPLAPETIFPTAIHECYAMLKKIITAETHLPIPELNTENIHLAGDSAGGNITAVLCHMFRDSAFIDAIKSQTLFYPVVDVSHFNRTSYMDRGFGYFLEKSDIEIFLNLYCRQLSDRDDWKMSPFLHPDFSNLPPAYIVTAEYDPLRDEGLDYHNKLIANGNKSIYTDAKGMIHGFINATIMGVSKREIKKAGLFIKSKS